MHESQRYDCIACGACCREAFDVVEIEDDDPFAAKHPELVHRTPFGRLSVNRTGDRCACLLVSAGRFTCRHYADRPQTCHDVEAGGEACRWARERVGLDPDGDQIPIR